MFAIMYLNVDSRPYDNVMNNAATANVQIILDIQDKYLAFLVECNTQVTQN